MLLNSTFELSMVLDSEKFHKVFARASKSAENFGKNEDCYPAFYLVPNHTSFSQIKKRHSINYSDGFYIRLPYAVSLVVL